jgi:hypothetical protein
MIRGGLTRRKTRVGDTSEPVCRKRSFDAIHIPHSRGNLSGVRRPISYGGEVVLRRKRSLLSGCPTAADTADYSISSARRSSRGRSRCRLRSKLRWAQPRLSSRFSLRASVWQSMHLGKLRWGKDRSRLHDAKLTSVIASFGIPKAAKQTIYDSAIKHLRGSVLGVIRVESVHYCLNRKVVDSSRNTNEASWLWRVAARNKRKGRGKNPASPIAVTTVMQTTYVHGKWRRRESNEQARRCKHQAGQRVTARRCLLVRVLSGMCRPELRPIVTD